ISTIKSIMTFLGALDKTTPEEIMLKDIQATIHDIYNYLLNTERNQEQMNADNWRGTDSNVRDKISNIMEARSSNNLRDLSDVSNELTKAITAMFSIDQGFIPLNKPTHGYKDKYLEGPVANPPGHWIDYAAPGIMTTSGNEPIPDYSDPGKTLGAFI